MALFKGTYEDYQSMMERSYSPRTTHITTTTKPKWLGKKPKERIIRRSMKGGDGKDTIVVATYDKKGHKSREIYADKQLEMHEEYINPHQWGAVRRVCRAVRRFIKSTARIRLRIYTDHIVISDSMEDIIDEKA